MRRIVTIGLLVPRVGLHPQSIRDQDSCLWFDTGRELTSLLVVTGYKAALINTVSVGGLSDIAMGLGFL